MQNQSVVSVARINIKNEKFKKRKTGKDKTLKLKKKHTTQTYLMDKLRPLPPP